MVPEHAPSLERQRRVNAAILGVPATHGAGREWRRVPEAIEFQRRFIREGGAHVDLPTFLGSRVALREEKVIVLERHDELVSVSQLEADERGVLEAPSKQTSIGLQA